MKLVTAMSAAALVLAPAVGLAQDAGNGAGDTQDQPGLKSKIEYLIGTITGSPSDTKESANAKSGDRNSAAKPAGNTNYPDFAKVKKTDK